MNKNNLFLLFLVFVFQLNFSQDRRVITTAVPFLMISADARASGLGEQGVATTPDAFSQHWNPSKYVFSENLSGVGVSYTPYLSKLVSDVFLANINYFNVIDQRSAWSASFKYFSLGDIDIIQNPQDIPLLENPNEFTLDASYSLKLSEYFSMAVTGRFLMSDVKLQSVDSNSDSASSFAVDISGFYQSEEKIYNKFNGIWRLGFNLSNIGPRMKYEELGKENFIPTNLKLGSAFDFIFDSSNKLSLNLELNKLLVPSPSVPIYNSNDEINYQGDSAEAHTKKMCDGMRAKGISVLSYFISSYDLSDDSYDVQAFKRMYGKDAEFVNATNMMAVAKSMNKKFLDK